MGRLDKYRKLPVFQKAEELEEIARVISESLKDGKSRSREHFISEMISNAYLIQVKIAGAAGSNAFSLKMQNAVVIKIAVQDMFNAVSASAMFKMGEEDYVDLMREKVEEFRLAFVDWIRGFDKTLDISDNWAIRYDTSTPEQEKLEELMLDEDRLFGFDDFDDSEEWEDESGD